MNCPSRTDYVPEDNGWNQNPSTLAADLTTRQDLNGMVNMRRQRKAGSRDDDDDAHVSEAQKDPLGHLTDFKESKSKTSLAMGKSLGTAPSVTSCQENTLSIESGFSRHLYRVGRSLMKFGRFIGPGFMVSVAYIDPGNYSTDVAAGASTRFKLLFIVLMSNVFAIVLQSLAVRLGSVTGLNLAEHCRAHLPRWLNIALYILGEAAIIATDIAEVSSNASFP